MSRSLTRDLLYMMEMEQKMEVELFQKSVEVRDRRHHLSNVQLIGRLRRDLAEIEERRARTSVIVSLGFVVLIAVVIFCVKAVMGTW